MSKEENRRFPGGVWPVMLTPFCEDGSVDFEALKALTEWYIENGASGLFAVCQSSEMYQMTREERVKQTETVVRAAAGRVPVIASGNICEDPAQRVEEVKEMAAAGADAVILITNQFADQGEDDEVWMTRCEAFVRQLPQEIALGFYECPYPYKRLISTENLKRCAETGRFYFLKDTCCDEQRIEERLAAIAGTPLQLYNANTTTLLASLRAGAVGFSGVMANFHPRLYEYLCDHRQAAESGLLMDFLTLASLIERQYYPVNAKYHMKKYASVPMTMYSRRQEEAGLTETFRQEVDMLYELESAVSDWLARQSAL